MAALNPEHLLDLAALAAKAATAAGGAPRQAYLRRSGSTAYYAVFHALCNTVAESFSGGSNPAWYKFYRAVDHGRAREHCLKPKQPASLKTFADNFVKLQQHRHSCDYSPEFKVAKAEALAILSDARLAIKSLNQAPDLERKEFLANLLLQARKP